MNFKLLKIADNIRLSLFKDNTVYFLDRGGLGGVALVRNNKVVAGATVEPEVDDWFVIETLWSDSPASTLVLLYSIVKYYKKILPSKDISPAALSVVSSFYKKFKGTEVVQDNVHPNGGNIPELAAGYIWSPKLKSVPVTLGKPESPEEVKLLWSSISSGFATAYRDPSRTKKENPDHYYNNFQLDNLFNLLGKWLEEGGEKESQAMKWMANHREELIQLGNKKTLKIVELYDVQLASY